MRSTKNICKIPSANYRDYKIPKLIELYRHLFKKGFANAHNALADCRATAECFFELKRLNLIQNSYIHTSIFNKKQPQIIIIEKEYPKKEIKTNQYKFENTNYQYQYQLQLQLDMVGYCYFNLLFYYLILSPIKKINYQVIVHRHQIQQHP